MIRLCGERYNPATDTLTLVGKKCPTRAQNNDYIMYLLKVLYVEANVSVCSRHTKHINNLFTEN